MSIRLLLAGMLMVLASCAGPKSNGRPATGEPGNSHPAAPGTTASSSSRAPALGNAISAARAALAAPSTGAEGRDVSAFYARQPDPFVWLDNEGRLRPPARAGVVLLVQAATEGLDPADYDAAEISTLAAALNQPSPDPAALAARFDVLLTRGVLRYYRHVHLGRVDPRTLGLQIDVPADTHDFPMLLQTAIEKNRVAETAAELTPPLFQYAALRAALARYRALAADPVDTPRFAGTVHVGDPVADLQIVHRILIRTGDLPAGTSLPASGLYDDNISVGVKQFQQRHGLDADGVIGPSTQRALAVPFSWRVRQIELALERLRWLPDLSAGRLIAVNIPMFRLWAWDSVPSSAPPSLDMAVVVGRALNTQTPVFANRMRYVVFRPYWNVPLSILRGEIVPSIRRDAGYFARQNLEIVRGQSDDSPVLPASPENLALLGQGDVRVRQRPGPGNALGLVKFMFPNQNDVYLHSTPAQQLFARSRRDFSHGCIRVEDPVALAEWVLGMPRERVVAAMNGVANNRVDLPAPVQIVIFYTTAAVMPDGSIHFAEDLYGQDAPLDKAL